MDMYSVLQDKLEQYFSKLVDLNRFSGCVLVAHNRQIIFEKAYGYLNREEQNPNQLETVFKIGSLSKQFTAFAILTLVEKGFLALNDHLGKFINGFPHGDKITVQHLLDHTSGLPADGDIGDGSNSSLRKIIHSNKSLHPMAVPGTTYQYSNLGYTLLAHLIEILSGVPFGVYVREAIFIPLELYHTAHFTHQQLLNELAVGYHYNKREFQPGPFISVGSLYGAGSLYSNVKDLFKWSEALSGKGRYKNELFKKMLTITPDTYYGFGLEHQAFKGRELISHTGLIHNFRAGFFLYPVEDYTLIFLSNMKPIPLGSVKEDVSAMIFNEKYDLPKLLNRQSIELETSQLDRFIGRFQLQSDPSQEIEIINENQQLFQLSEGEKLPLYPESSHRFFTDEQSIETLIFDRDCDSLNYLTSDGWEAVLKRVYPSSKV